MRALGLLLVATLGSGCIIEPPDLIRLDGGDEFDGGSRPPVNGGWVGGFGLDWDGGLGGGWDGGAPGNATFPGSGTNGDPGTGVIWLVRIDRGTANLAASYATLIQTMTQQLAAQGFDIRTTAVGSLYEPRLYWSGAGKTVPVANLQSLLANAASQGSGEAPSTCSSTSLLSIGARLDRVEVVPPDGSHSGLRPFEAPRSTLLVVMLDHGVRPVGHDSPGCNWNGFSPAQRFGNGRDVTQWLNQNAPSWNLPRARTRFLFVSTPENESYSQLRERCAAMSTFPRIALDALNPSVIPFYGPFSSGLNAFQPGLGTQVDLCQAVARDWPGFSRGFAKDWADLLSRPQ
jgi:hypothetical protein